MIGSSEPTEPEPAHVRPKFIQISAVSASDGTSTVYALDENGRVWWFFDDENVWLDIEVTRVTDP